MNFVIFADATERTIVEKTQQLRLHTRRHFANFIQQHRTAIRLFKKPFYLPAHGQIVRFLPHLPGLKRS